MQIKRLVNDKPLWDSFLEEVDSRIAACHKQLEQCRDTNEMFRLQGQVSALRSLKQLREAVNGPEPKY